MMPEHVDDLVTVEFAPSGQPHSFIWHRFEYVVRGFPQVFFRRRSWWLEGSDLGRIDQELWRVEAASVRDPDVSSLYDLARDSESWRLVRAWE